MVSFGGFKFCHLLHSVCVARDEKEELGLRLSRLAPFLRLYAHYTSRFDTAMETLTEYSKKEKKFDVALKEFEVCCHDWHYM